MKRQGTARLTAATLVCLLMGCAAGPTVKPFERGQLADPILSFTPNPLDDRFRQHAFDVREGARGATSSQGSGCGCN